MTWKEFKARCEELGIEDDQQIGIDSIDDDGVALFHVETYLGNRSHGQLMKVKEPKHGE
jgi:hypothetical protein